MMQSKISAQQKAVEADFESLLTDLGYGVSLCMPFGHLKVEDFDSQTIVLVKFNWDRRISLSTISHLAAEKLEEEKRVDWDIKAIVATKNRFLTTYPYLKVMRSFASAVDILLTGVKWAPEAANVVIALMGDQKAIEK